jgi:Tol biopolymer transport system component/DNA-binding winged helix-turn-helix (wHTH) protein
MENGGKHLVFRFGDFELREKEHRLQRSGEEMHLQPQVFRLLLYLVHNRDRVVQKDEIVREVWESAAVTDNSLTRSIYLLRKILDDDPADSRAIRTVSSIGYQFVCAVEQVEDCAVSPKLAEVAFAIEEAAKPDAPEISPAASAGDQNRPPRRLERVWIAAGVVGILVLLAAGVWYLRRPLPPPHISEYVQITSDGRPKILGGTDGSRLYFTLMPSTTESPHSFGEVAVTGGEMAQIPVTVPGGQFMAVDVSRDGSSALIASVEKGNMPFAFWSASLVGGSLRRLLQSAQGAAYSPDGRFVAYTTAEGDLCIMGSDGNGAHKVGSVGAGGAYMPAWSPDGKTISFQRGNRIWEVASNGSNPRQMLSGWNDADGQCCGHWTADGKFFLFASGDLWGDRGQLWALDERRGLLRQPPAEPIRLTLGPTRWGTPISSRDGKTIFAEGTTPRGELSRYDAQSRQFHTFLKGISAESVVFSKDGKSVAYVTYPEGILWKANRDGSSPVQLSQKPMYPAFPRWSPDGKQILFTDSGPVDRIYIVPAEGGSPRRLLPKVDQEVSEADWSADGKKIVFSLFDWRTDDPLQGDLRILDLASGEVSAISGSAGLFWPRWSPDGRKIAALTSQSQGLRVYDTERQLWSALVTKDLVEFPTFSADSQFLYYLLLGGDQAVYRVRVRGGEPERVVDLKDWHITGHFSFWMGLDQTDAPLLLRDSGTSDLYALTLELK